MTRKSMVLAAVLLAVGLGAVWAQDGGTVVQGDSFVDKMAWLQAFAQTGGSYIVELSTDESISAYQLEYSGKRNITITLRGADANRTLSSSSSGTMFTVRSGVTLVLDNNITLKGWGYRTPWGGSIGVVIWQGGTLVMNDGSTITGCYTVSGRGDGGGVLLNGGTFTMNGGTISGNSAWNGGAVHIDKGTFTMSDGTISGNTASSTSPCGGGVYVGGGTFTMSGGTISGNTASYGGGVYGTFTMSDGEISGNTSSYDGGGVYVGSGTFTMNGGTISGNTASSRYGGGVSVKERGTFTMSDGTIFGNTATTSGGGVYVEGGTFTMRGGTITGNTARENGGGVYVSGTFAKTGGTITGYASDRDNGNAVKEANGTVRNFRGHAVYASGPKIREGTAGPRDNLSYSRDGGASGAWDN